MTTVSRNIAGWQRAHELVKQSDFRDSPDGALVFDRPDSLSRDFFTFQSYFAPFDAGD
jgi:hypothetical protein